MPATHKIVYRHSLAVRVTHWIWALCLAVLLMSGLQIFNAHGALYWGPASTFGKGWLSMQAVEGSDGKAQGVTALFGHRFDTTGVLGLAPGPDGDLTERPFPAWITLPSGQDLALARRWHFFFAWLLVLDGFAFYAFAFAGGHWRALVPSRQQLAGIGRSIWNHLRLRFPHGADYNVLQKLAYLAVLFVLLPLMVLSGLAMAPALDNTLPLIGLFGGRQVARTIHFVTASGLVLFFVVHIAMVLVSGVWNNLRSMITGRYVTHSGGEDGEA
jgi:thiosulfate reductase cytochrome b subunit